jgi:hypothetical protein
MGGTDTAGEIRDQGRRSNGENTTHERYPKLHEGARRCGLEGGRGWKGGANGGGGAPTCFDVFFFLFARRVTDLCVGVGLGIDENNRPIGISRGRQAKLEKPSWGRGTDRYLACGAIKEASVNLGCCQGQHHSLRGHIEDDEIADYTFTRVSGQLLHPIETNYYLPCKYTNHPSCVGVEDQLAPVYLLYSLATGVLAWLARKVVIINLSRFLA